LTGREEGFRAAAGILFDRDMLCSRASPAIPPIAKATTTVSRLTADIVRVTTTRVAGSVNGCPLVIHERGQHK